MNGQYEVLSPWAEADPVPLKGLSSRVADLEGKKIGLFTITYKHASARVNSVVEKRLKEKFPTAEFNHFKRNQVADFDNEYQFAGRGTVDSKEVLAKFEEWVNGVDAVVGAVGD